MRSFEVKDVSSWGQVAEEPAGLRAKLWVVDDSGRRWLRKRHRDARPSEPVIESLALALAEVIQLPTARGHACEWQENGVVRRGSLIANFLEPKEELAHGFELIQGREDTRLDASDKQALRAGQTLERARKVLSSIDGTAPDDMLDPFVRMLVFDAWIGNGDRHAMNWGVVRLAGKPTKLAPMYDPACCLGVEMQEPQVRQKLKSDAVLAAYAERCGSGFGDGEKILRMTGVTEVLRTWPRWKELADPLIGACARVLEEQKIENWWDNVPDEWLSQDRKTFVLRLLYQRLDLLRRAST